MDIFHTLKNELEQRLGRTLGEKEEQLVGWMTRTHEMDRDDRRCCDGRSSQPR